MGYVISSFYSISKQKRFCHVESYPIQPVLCHTFVCQKCRPWSSTSKEQSGPINPHGGTFSSSGAHGTVGRQFANSMRQSQFRSTSSHRGPGKPPTNLSKLQVGSWKMQKNGSPVLSKDSQRELDILFKLIDWASTNVCCLNYVVLSFSTGTVHVTVISPAKDSWDRSKDDPRGYFQPSLSRNSKCYFANSQV